VRIADATCEVPSRSYKQPRQVSDHLTTCARVVSKPDYMAYFTLVSTANILAYKLFLSYIAYTAKRESFNFILDNFKDISITIKSYYLFPH